MEISATPAIQAISQLIARFGYIKLKNVVVRGGFEPPTPGFSVLCSTN
jgi:hypothetical protein